ncbi:glycine zipper 2TM domain-containing protein [Arenimonas oryziterrae]|uniref:Glycine zipper 2TM domain-containing protein n=1 Tax=Arenimonas oryziterrae DSM 21050 = YC6267 TaxID=1121015 RepID=A0A091APP1_9GAMM|nr:glycine zipper 2TM domain-containing protein [Arenimonas oryziterrae]KFN41107.1 hypothetical protein N789_04265 [Arenimonas oryziterrae DSM 21050 = YC6267]
MERLFARVAVLVLLAGSSGMAAAQSQGQGRGPDENVTYGYAQVLRARPAFETFRIRTPEQRCEGQAVRDGGNPTGGTVAGAVVGGALGNQVGKGDGRKAATVAGAVAGAVIGRNIDRNNGSASSGRCRTVEVEREERRVVGYDVEYVYKGEKYMSRLPYDPGNRLRVRVSVTPEISSIGYR